jgi:UDP:flavonoid glycosyltransferase YjiC (YdhE family)
VPTEGVGAEDLNGRYVKGIAKRLPGPRPPVQASDAYGLPVRVLASCLPGYGHFHPMVPLALALRDAGAQVAFATERRFCARVTAAGFPAFPAGIGPGKVLERTLRLADAAGPDDTSRFGAQMFAAVAAPAKVPDLMAVIDEWWPDLLVHDITDFAGPVAAAAAGIPDVAHSLGPLFPIALFRHGAELVVPLWQEWGVTPGPLGGMFGAAYLDICPPSLQSPDVVEVAATTLPLRPVPFDAVEGETLPPWVEALPPRPTVYVTLGTLDNNAPGVLEAAVEGLRDEPVNAIVTVGPNRDPEELGPQPAHIRVERYVPQSLLLPKCDVVVAHGGSGTTLGALAHGLPLLLLPQGANQFENAERCAALGAGIRLLPGEVGAEPVRRAVRALLDEPGYRARAREVAGEIERMPAPAEVSRAVVELARTR